MATLRQRFSSAQVAPPVRPRKQITFDDVLAKLEERGRTVDREFLQGVYEFSSEGHRDQKRRSGEPFLTHPLYVAYLLAEFPADETAVAVGLLHDVLEDTLTTRESLAERFGDEIAALVDGVTKIGKHEYVRRDKVQAESFRKLILASTRDARVILVKLADRLHNMLTLEAMAPEARRRISRETLEIYAPIAHRLGMSKVQGDLEDLAFFHLYPLQFSTLETKVEEKLKGGKAGTDQIRSEMEKCLAEAGVEAEISFRVKRYYSIYRKMRRQGIDVSQLYDYLAFRIVNEDVRDCYAALGVVHQVWRPVPGRFKDYIAMPKPNLYQSLHTTVVGDAGQPFEIQIRTREMDAIAEEGIAAHWRYKESGQAAEARDQEVGWLRQLLEMQQEVEDPRTFLTTLKIDLYPDEVYAFTPKGDVLSLPRGATPLDFAYKIHTELGHHCIGARVNGKLVPLRSELQNGDIVEIQTNAGRWPSRDWLSFVRTSRAKSKIRQWLNTEQRKRSREIGRRAFERGLKKHKVSPKRVYESPALKELLAAEGMGDVEDLLSRIGFGKIAVRPLLDRLLTEEQLSTTADKPSRLREAVTRILPFSEDHAVQVRGDSDLLAYRAKCCNPLPGEEIVGYITRGKGVSVHSVECNNVKNLLFNPEREIEVEWARAAVDSFPVSLVVEIEDRQGVLARVTEAIAKQSTNIRHFEAGTFDDGRGRVEILLEVRDSRHLDKVTSAIQKLSGVLEIRRRRGPGRVADSG